VIPPDLGAATVEHLVLTYGSLFISALIALPLAVLCIYDKRLANVIITIANLLQAIPSFAVVAIVVPLMGIGFEPAIVAILLRALLPIIKNTYIGMAEVDSSIIDSAKGIGLTQWQIIKKIRIPNAYPAIFAGLKFAAILANSIAILTAIIGSGGLGTIIFAGLSNLNTDKILAGSLPTIGIAIFIDVSFSIVERLISPSYTAAKRK